MSDAAAQASEPLSLTPHVPLRRVEIVVNPLSGGVGVEAAPEVERIMRRFACESRVVEVHPPRVEKALEEALAEKPDLLIVLAGDGTARAAAAMAGPSGPLIAPLPGGTMNMLPKALYGTGDWREALHLTLRQGAPRAVQGGSVDGRPFYVAAILGSPALWAPAREAVRERKPRLAFLYAKRALRRAFSTRVRFKLDDGEFQRGEALALLSPLVSKAMDRPDGLEAALLDPASAAQAIRLAATAVIGDWRDDKAVETRVVRTARVWSRRPIPAILDGEPVQLDKEVAVEFLPEAFRALAPPPEALDAHGVA